MKTDRGYNFENFYSKTKTLSVTSGKGGVGKSTLVANMALNLASQGKKVLILDGDLGMANIDIMFGVKPKYTIEDVIKHGRHVEEVVIEASQNVYLIPGGSGVYSLQNLNTFEKMILVDQVSQLEHTFDYMIIDTAPGIDDKVLYLNAAAQEILVVITPDPSSLADSYALIKLMNQKYKEHKFSIVVNMVGDEAEGRRLYSRFNDVCNQFLCVNLSYKGCIPSDQSLRLATKSQQLVMNSNPSCSSSQAMQSIVRKLSSYNGMGASKGGLQFFWEQFVGVA